MKNKFNFLSNMNMSLEISDRDKKLIMIVVAAGIIAASYLLGYQNTVSDRGY